MMQCPGARFIAFNIGIGLSALIVASSLSHRAARSPPILCCAIGSQPIPAIRTSRPTSRESPEIAQSDIATAIKFCKNASASSRRAMYELGRAYAANRQMSEAVSAWRKAAEKGSTSAMVELGVLLGTGSGVAKDQAEARKLVGARSRGRQPSRRYQSRRAFRRCWYAVRSRQGESSVGESSRRELGGSSVSAWIDERGWRRRCKG